MRFVEPVRGPGQMVRPPGVEPGQGRQEVQEMTETRNSSVKQKPHIPTISRMKKPPVSRGPARELGRCRQTYPLTAAGVVRLRSHAGAGAGTRTQIRRLQDTRSAI